MHRCTCRALPQQGVIGLTAVEGRACLRAAWLGVKQRGGALTAGAFAMPHRVGTAGLLSSKTEASSHPTILDSMFRSRCTARARRGLAWYRYPKCKPLCLRSVPARAASRRRAAPKHESAAREHAAGLVFN
jgi:hypothetical protein